MSIFCTRGPESDAHFPRSLDPVSNPRGLTRGPIGQTLNLPQGPQNCSQEYVPLPKLKDLNLSPAEVADTEACSGTCTSVNRQCSHRGTCSCYAQKVSLVAVFFFWHTAKCGPARLSAAARATIGGADGGLKLKRSGNVSALAEVYNASTYAEQLSDGASAGNASMIVWDALPAPCNASYVSYACANSSDGVVHESPEKWLGALLPAQVDKLPPVPAAFLRIHGLKNQSEVGVTPQERA